MRIFVTGATGFIGSAVVPLLIEAGHHVIGMTRSDAGAEALTKAGAEPHRGLLEDVDSIAAGAAKAEAVVHLAFDHDFSRFVENCAKDVRVIKAIGAVLKGTNHPFVITSGTGMGNAHLGEPASEDVFNIEHPNPRSGSEIAGRDLLESGVNVSIVRLPQVHNTRRQGLISPLIAIAREKGVSAYIGEGRNRWPAGHVSDTARLYKLAIEKGQAGARWHAVGEEGVSAKDIAESLGRGLKLPVISLPAEKAQEHFGWMGMFVTLDFPASSALTQQRLGWKPVGPTLIADLDKAEY